VVIIKVSTTISIGYLVANIFLTLLSLSMMVAREGVSKGERAGTELRETEEKAVALISGSMQLNFPTKFPI